MAPVALSGLLLVFAHAHGFLEVVLPVVPLLLLITSLLLGLYPGCDAIVRLAERIASRLKAATAIGQRRPAPPPGYAAHGGLLLALALAGRSPPD